MMHVIYKIPLFDVVGNIHYFSTSDQDGRVCLTARQTVADILKVVTSVCGTKIYCFGNAAMWQVQFTFSKLISLN